MKIHCIIQARMSSTRLPGKVLKDIGGGRCVLGMVYERCLRAKGIDTVIVASHGFTFSEAVNVEGPEEPAARFIQVLAEHPCDGFVRVCADSPFIDHESVEEAAYITDSGDDYWHVGQQIHGNQAEGFNTQAFLNAEPSMQGDEREHLGLWFQRRDRLTVDTPGDLERARLIVSRMTKPHIEYTAAECLELLRNG